MPRCDSQEQRAISRQGTFPVLGLLYSFESNFAGSPSVATIVSVRLRTSFCLLVQLCWSLRSVEGICPNFTLVSNRAWAAATASPTGFGVFLWSTPSFGQDMAIRVYSAKSKALLSTLPPPPNSKVPFLYVSHILLNFKCLSFGGWRYSKLSGSKWRNAVNRKASIARYLD